ncbi:MAG: hypothetical protein EXQ69_04575 [Acidimicrobiia bacterium]|nr:hypothetical protein [Acidimicrobiia bacterium]
MAAGGLAFLWVTSRRRLVSLGYGWLLRGVFGVLAVASIILETHADHAGNGQVVFLVGTAGMVIGASVATLVSVLRRSAGVARKRELQVRRVARVAAMVGGGDAKSNGSDVGREFPPSLDLIAPAFGVFALLGAATFTGEHWWLSAVRLLVGAAFLGAILDAMLLGHWYLTQPGLSREPLRELVRASAIIWPLEIVVLIIPLGMMSVLLGTIDDGYNGLLGWMWAVCALGTIALLGATWLALRERAYSAVMAATGLLYLAILTAFGTDLLARALLTP